MTNKTHNRFSAIVSTWKKSHADSPSAWVRRNEVGGPVREAQRLASDPPAACDAREVGRLLTEVRVDVHRDDAAKTLYDQNDGIAVTRGVSADAQAAQTGIGGIVPESIGRRLSAAPPL